VHLYALHLFSCWFQRFGIRHYAADKTNGLSAAHNTHIDIKTDADKEDNYVDMNAEEEPSDNGAVSDSLKSAMQLLCNIANAILGGLCPILRSMVVLPFQMIREAKYHSRHHP
jgi:hypothetical protein